jgi:hypothetical protein
VDWTPVDLPDLVAPWSANGVIADSDGLVVYGGIGDRPAVWTSRDGLSWAAAALPGGFGFPASAAASTTATVLLGAGTTSRCAHPFGEFLWRRTSGATSWDAVPFVEPLFCAGGFAEISETRDAFAVVGMGTGDQPFAWQSGDGMAWRDAAAGIPFDAPPSVVAGDAGGFLELGRGGRTDARTSIDGSAWSAVQAPPVPPAFNGDAPGMSPAVLLATPVGMLAIYQSDGADTRSAWRRNADGSWTEIKLVGFEPGDAISGGVTVLGTPFVFGGRQGTANLWTSIDLATWTHVPIPEAMAVLGLATFGGRTVLVVWIEPTGGPNVTRAYVTSNSLGGS